MTAQPTSPNKEGMFDMDMLQGTHASMGGEVREREGGREGG